MWYSRCCRRFLKPLFRSCGPTDCGCVQLVFREYNARRLCLEQYSTQKPTNMRRRLGLLMAGETKFSVWNLFELASYGKSDFSRPDLDGKKLAEGAIGFVWYTNKKSRKYSASKTVMAAKGILLLVNGCQNYKDIEGGYLMALKLLADFTVTDGMDVLEAKIVALSKLADFYAKQNEWIKAENTMIETMQVMLRGGVADNIVFMETSIKLARVFHNQKRIQAAEAGFDWCVATSREMYTLKKDDGFTMLYRSLWFRATFYNYMNRHSEAIRDLMDVVELFKDGISKDDLRQRHQTTLMFLNLFLELVIRDSGGTERAVSLIQFGIGMVNGLLEDSTESEVEEVLKTYLAVFYGNLAKIQSSSGNHSLALEAREKANKILEDLHDEQLSIAIWEGRKCPK